MYQWSCIDLFKLRTVARCCGKHWVSLNADNVILFSDSMSDFIQIRSYTLTLSWLQVCLSHVRIQRTSTGDLCFLCLILRCSCQNMLKGMWVLRSSGIRCSNKISLCKQSGSNVLYHQPAKSRVRYLLLGSHHSKVEIIHQDMKASFPNLNVIGGWIPFQTLHSILCFFRLRQLLTLIFFDKKKCESTCQ